MTIGKYSSSISALKLDKDVLRKNTLILAEEGSGKTNLASKIRKFAIDSSTPTLYMDFSNPSIDDVEKRYIDSDFNYLRFDESEEFSRSLNALIDARAHIYLAVNPDYFTNKRDKKSTLSQMISNKALLDNYYYFFHEIAQLNAFYTKFEDFLLYLFGLIHMQKFGMTFLTQPHEIFENAQLKLLFSNLFVGRCSNANYFNTAVLKNLGRNRFYFQHRLNHCSLLFNPIKSDIVTIYE